MNPFIAGWLCGWGAIVLAGVIAGMVLRIMNRWKPYGLISPKRGVRTRYGYMGLQVSPVERKARKAHDDLVNACTRWIDEREREK